MVSGHPRLIGVAVLVAAALVAGCGDDYDGTSASSTNSAEVSSDMLDGRTFESTDVSGETLVDGTNVTLTFEGDAMSADAGCNTLNATYEVEDGALTIGPMNQTMMACEDELELQSAWVAALLDGEPTVTLVDDTLTIASDSTTVTFQST